MKWADVCLLFLLLAYIYCIFIILGSVLLMYIKPRIKEVQHVLPIILIIIGLLIIDVGIVWFLIQHGK